MDWTIGTNRILWKNQIEWRDKAAFPQPLGEFISDYDDLTSSLFENGQVNVQLQTYSPQGFVLEVSKM